MSSSADILVACLECSGRRVGDNDTVELVVSRCWLLGARVGHRRCLRHPRGFLPKLFRQNLLRWPVPIFRTLQLGVFIGQLTLYNQQHSSTW